MAIIVCAGCGAKNRVPQPAPVGVAKCGRCKAALPTLVMNIVDIGAIRYFDGRGIPREAWIGGAPFEQAIAGDDTRERPNAYVWVLAGEMGAFLDEIGEEAAVVFFGWFRGRLLGPRLEGTVLVCVDREGWAPRKAIEAIAQAVGVQIALGLPVLVEPGTTRTTRELLDQAGMRR